jgi:hypothetical protein
MPILKPEIRINLKNVHSETYVKNRIEGPEELSRFRSILSRTKNERSESYIAAGL